MVVASTLAAAVVNNGQTAMAAAVQGYTTLHGSLERIGDRFTPIATAVQMVEQATRPMVPMEALMSPTVAQGPAAAPWTPLADPADAELEEHASEIQRHD